MKEKGKENLALVNKEKENINSSMNMEKVKQKILEKKKEKN